MKVKMFLLTLGFIAFSSFAFAQTGSPAVTHKQVKHSKRIKQGVKSGELTLKETAMLTRQQAKIQRAKKHAKRDGVVTKVEKAKLTKMQTRASRNIYRQKNDRQ